MRTTLTLLAAWALIVPSAGADDAKKDDTKKDAVRKIDLTGFKAERARGTVEKPLEINSAEDLARTFTDKEIQERIKKDVNFETEKLLFFAWAGSGGDKLAFTVEKGSDAPVVMFTHTPGLTRDLRQHFLLYAMPKKATFKVGK